MIKMIKDVGRDQNFQGFCQVSKKIYFMHTLVSLCFRSNSTVKCQGFLQVNRSYFISNF